MSQVVVIHRTRHFRGDHDADVEYSYVFKETDTLRFVLQHIKPKNADSIIIPAKGGES